MRLPEITAVKMALGKIHAVKPHPRGAQILYGFVPGNMRDKPLCLLILVCLMHKTDIGTANCRTAATGNARDKSKHRLLYHNNK